jgi:molybdenum cofactor synthesis domain-containing protein
MIRVGVITISDRGFKGEREDTSGAVIRELVQLWGAQVELSTVVPDEIEKIMEALIQGTDEMHLDLILTTGGTGVSPRDLTPEATRQVLEREVPGIAEAMRHAGMKKTPHAMISRAIAGIRGRTLIVNLPGSPQAVREGLEAVLPALPHAIAKIQGDPRDCAE